MPADPVGELRTNKPLELAGGWTSNAEAAPIAPQNTVNASPRRIIAPARASFRRRAVTKTALLDGRRYTCRSYGSVMDLPGGRKGYRADADAVAKQARSRCRPRWSRDTTVPLGVFMIAAISL